MHVLSMLFGHLRISAARTSEHPIRRHDGRRTDCGEHCLKQQQAIFYELTVEARGETGHERGRSRMLLSR